MDGSEKDDPILYSTFQVTTTTKNKMNELDPRDLEDDIEFQDIIVLEG